ncbi:hypothetical protein DFP82_10951 [Psychrobacter fozii]|uniref:Uncharacterized protein n=2 Tax=Psychrobacter fozii TaxID=198480 RepID=A0A2V4VS14_9GAMM|nr:hypothetical protein DFP82_10951 [Psychrobacter fozii]
MKDYISFRDFIFHLSSVNDESLYEVVTYLLHYDLGAVDFYNIDTDHKIIRFKPGEFDTVTEFLKEIQKALSFSSEKWVWSNPTSLKELRDQDRRALTDTVSKAMHCFFKKADVSGFEPLNGLLHFEDVDVKHTVQVENIEDLIDSEFEKQHREYVAVNDFVNDLYKGIGSGKPLKFTLKSLLENTPLREVKLYRFQNLNYSLVSPTDNSKYKNTDDLLRHFYNVLDDEQTGTVTSDREPFKDFYFNHSEIQDLVNSDLNVETKQLNQIDKQLPTPPPMPLEDKNVINDLGENQRLLITYAFFTLEDMTCLIIDENPAYINNDANYLRHHRMVCNAIDAGSLVPNDTDRISAEQVKTWLANHNFIYKGFNDNLSNDRDKVGIAVVGHVFKTYDQLVEELVTANNTIKDLKNKLAQVDATKYSYITPAMEIMDAVINEFWVNYDPEQQAPKQLIITDWITQNFDISPALALNIDKVCRHSDARRGGQYKRS